MKTETMPEFMVIDDDPINNLICMKVIQHEMPGAVVQTFTNPEKGLEYILSAYTGQEDKNGVLFLDINMPWINGWEVLEKLKIFPDIIMQQLKVFILSSSVELDDMAKAFNEPVVTGYISKPLSMAAWMPYFQ